MLLCCYYCSIAITAIIAIAMTAAIAVIIAAIESWRPLHPLCSLLPRSIWRGVLLAALGCSWLLLAELGGCAQLVGLVSFSLYSLSVMP